MTIDSISKKQSENKSKLLCLFSNSELVIENSFVYFLITLSHTSIFT
jgi:hypothetical protein